MTDFYDLAIKDVAEDAFFFKKKEMNSDKYHDRVSKLLFYQGFALHRKSRQRSSITWGRKSLMTNLKPFFGFQNIVSKAWR